MKGIKFFVGVLCGVAFVASLVAVVYHRLYRNLVLRSLSLGNLNGFGDWGNCTTGTDGCSAHSETVDLDISDFDTDDDCFTDDCFTDDFFTDDGLADDDCFTDESLEQD